MNESNRDFSLLFFYYSLEAREVRDVQAGGDLGRGQGVGQILLVGEEVEVQEAALHLLAGRPLEEDLAQLRGGLVEAVRPCAVHHDCVCVK